MGLMPRMFMPELIEPSDLYTDRYMDPDSYPSFDSEGLALREYRSRYRLWQWYYWFYEGIRYWNVAKGPRPPQIEHPADKKARLLDLLDAEERKILKAETERILNEQQLERWIRLNEELIAKHDLLQARLERHSGTKEELEDKVRRKEFETYKEELGREKEMGALRARLEELEEGIREAGAGVTVEDLSSESEVEVILEPPARRVSWGPTTIRFF